ncbi:MAG: 30S ribosomal protein THX [Saprospiraceae bacterium]
MGKGDKRSRRGKIWRGSYGKARPKQKNIEKDIFEAAAAVAPEAVAEATKSEE